MFRILYFCLLGCLLLITSVTAHRLKTVLKMLDEIYHGQANWTTLIPAEWIDRALDIPGSGYVIAFVYWLRRPILLCFLLPLTILIFVYVSVLFIYLCRLRWWLARQLTEWWPLRPRRRTRYHSFSSVPRANLASLAQLAKRLIAALWDAHGRIVHAYEIVGMEKLPMTGPALVIYYHGTCPFDAYYFLARHCIERDRFPVAVVDRFLFRMPLMRSTLELMGAVEGSIGELVSHLSPGSRSGRTSHESDKEVSEGDVVLLAPGGVREALFADESYSILWGRRTGFARVAILASQPIFPMFTENIRETIRIVQFGKSFWRKIYERTRLPFALFYGFFPVKLRTYIGDPIYPRPGESPEELSERVRAAMEQMIKEHQWTPSNLFCALLQRIPAFDRWFEGRKRLRQAQ